MTQIKVSRGNYTGYDALLKSAGVYNVDADIDMNANKLRDLDDLIFAESGQEILSTTGGLQLRVPTGDDIDVLINGILEYSMNATEFNANATNNIANFADLVSAISGVEIQSSSSGWDLRVATGDDIDLIFNGIINYSFDEEEFFMGANHIRLLERLDPAAPAANSVLFYAKDNGAGKTQLVARFATGAIQVVAQEP